MDIERTKLMALQILSVPSSADSPERILAKEYLELLERMELYKKRARRYQNSLEAYASGENRLGFEYQR